MKYATYPLKSAGWLIAAVLATVSLTAAADPGVTDSTIRVGGVMDLKGDSRGLGLGMKAGIEAAFRGVVVQGRHIEFTVLNDNYSPPKTIAATKKLVSEGVFAVVGNVGTPTAKVSLPILAKSGTPAVGFFTGAGLLRPGVGNIINYRASYVQETAAVIKAALASGLKPSNVCAYVQNDAYGMAGVQGIKLALEGKPGMKNVIPLLDDMMSMTGNNPPRNFLGPVGVYQRNTLYSRDGYQSLKSWEKSTGSHCRLVVSVGTYAAIARFTAYSRLNGDHWLVSAVSFTGADNFKRALAEFGVHSGVVMTQVVPPLDSDLPIVADARSALGSDFGYVSLEGYIVGRMFVDGLKRINGPITRSAFLAAMRGHRIDLGGLPLDFTNDNQGSDLVITQYLDPQGYRAMTAADWNTVAGTVASN